MGKSQTTKVLEYMKKHKKGITSMVAFWRFGITRLSGRIYELRNRGCHILSIREPNKLNDGYHARYVLSEEQEWWTV